MSMTCRIEATVRVPCRSRTMTDVRGIKFTANEAHFEHYLMPDGFEHNSIIVHGKTAPGEGYNGGSTSNVYVWYDYSGQPVPAWLPTPPDGWDLGVRIEAERRAIDAEAASA